MAGLLEVPDYDSLAEELADADRPWLDRRDVEGSQLDDECGHWRQHGYLIVPGLLPDDLIDAYRARFEAYHCLQGFQTPSPYEVVPELRALSLYPPVVERIEKLIGNEMVLHLNLTGWVSTERNWHQDDYLNAARVNGWYLAVWMALDDIGPETGPFQFIPGSHRWPVLRRDRVRALMTPEEERLDAADPNSAWTLFTQEQVAAAVEQRRHDLGVPYQSFLAKKGDVLFWHACLQHRGSEPVRRRSLLRRGVRAAPLRRALISHYTAKSRAEFTEDMLVSQPGGGCYAVFHNHVNHFHGGGEAPLGWRIRKRLDWALRQR